MRTIKEDDQGDCKEYCVCAVAVAVTVALVCDEVVAQSFGWILSHIPDARIACVLEYLFAHLLLLFFSGHISRYLSCKTFSVTLGGFPKRTNIRY